VLYSVDAKCRGKGQVVSTVQYVEKKSSAACMTNFVTGGTRGR
jgi:hypothetical protein